MCRGLEAEEEKVLPFYVSTLSKEDEDDIKDVIAEPSMEPLAEVRTCSLNNLYSATVPLFGFLHA